MTATEIPSPPVPAGLIDPAPAPRVTTAADPALLGFPGFAIGALALGLFLTGFNQTTIPSTLAAPLPIMIVTSGLLLMIATVWAAAKGDGTHAAIFGLFGTFWLSFSVLVLGLLNNWFGELPEPAQRGAQANFLLLWFVMMTVVTFATLRLPKMYTILFILIDIALITLFAAVSIAAPGPGGDPVVLHPGVVAIFLMPVVGMYLFASAMNTATGGRPFRLGKPFKKA